MSKTSSAVKSRWNRNNYKQFLVSLRVDKDAELIEYIEKNKAAGTTEVFRQALEEKMKRDGQ